MYCRNCGSRIDDGSAVCPVCGEVFSGAGDPGQHSGRKSGKKPREGKPLVLFICLGVLAAAALFVYFVLKPEFGGREKPYGGAKLKKQKIWDNELLTVTAEGIDDASGEYYYCDAVGLTVSNRSGGPLTLSCLSMAVNGASVQPVLSEEIPPGETVKAELVMDNYSLDDMMVKTVDTITMEFTAADPAGNVLARSGILSAATTKKGKGDQPEHKYEAQPLFEEGGVSVGSEGFRPVGTTMRYGVCFHVDNESGGAVRFLARDIVLNDLPYDTKAEGCFQSGTLGVCYARTDFAELEKIDKERPLFPITAVSGICELYSAESGEKLAEFPFEYRK